MRNTVLSYLFLPLFAGLSFSLSAAPNPAPVPAELNASAVATPATVAHTTRVNLNAADAPTLQKELNGIGKAKAEAIVAYRDAHGPFTSVDELLEIKGIGNAILDRNRDKLTVE